LPINLGIAAKPDAACVFPKAGVYSGTGRNGRTAENGCSIGSTEKRYGEVAALDDLLLDVRDRVAVLKIGRLAQIGAPERRDDRPCNAFAASFIGEATRLAVTRGRDALRLDPRDAIVGPRNAIRPPTNSRGRACRRAASIPTKPNSTFRRPSSTARRCRSSHRRRPTGQ
jgi:hypothetical protein